MDRGVNEHNIQEVNVENEEVEGEGESHGEQQPDVAPGRHDHKRLVLGAGVEGVGHLNGHKDGQSHSHGLRSMENLAGHVVGQLPEGHLGAGGVEHEPVGGTSDSGSTDVDTNGHVSEEEPWGDEGLIGRTGLLVHDIKVGRVEGQGGGGQTVSDKVDPQQLDGDEGLGQTEGGSQEDGHNLTDVGGDQVSNKLLHVIVDSSAFLHSGDNGGEVIVSQHHL